MITENLSTLKIHKLTQSQYDRELEAGNIDASALYLTPEEKVTKAQLGLGNVENKSSADIRGELTKNDVTTALGYTPPTADNSIIREFDSELIDGMSFSYSGTNSKFYVITYSNIDSSYVSTIMVDYRAIRAGITEYHLPNNGVLYVTISNNSIGFSAENMQLLHICGYY